MSYFQALWPKKGGQAHRDRTPLGTPWPKPGGKAPRTPQLPTHPNLSY